MVRTATREYDADVVSYLNAAVSAFHCVAEVRRRLLAAGFEELDERRPWAGAVKPGGSYFVTRNGSSLLAFAVGGAFDEATSGAIVVGAHTDSPCPKLKPCSKLEKAGAKMMGVVGYGGGIWHSWFDRDLTLVGRALYAKGGRPTHALVDLGKPICRIPTLAIHLSVGDERSTFKPNLQSHLPPMLASGIRDALAAGDLFGGAECLCARRAATAARGAACGRRRRRLGRHVHARRHTRDQDARAARDGKLGGALGERSGYGGGRRRAVGLECRRGAE